MTSSQCQCELGLGVVNFPKSLHEDDCEDPLVKLFEDCKWSFQNPLTKEKEMMSVFGVINSQSHLSQSNDKSFKMFPPCILPSENLVPGFPKHLFNEDISESNLSDEKTKFIDKWQEDFLSIHAEDSVTRAFYSVFSNFESRGFMIQSYHFECYLQPLINKSKQQRKNEAKIQGKAQDLIEISELEKNIMQTLKGIKG